MATHFICLGCGKKKPESPRSAGRQSYCGHKDCQRKRKAGWQRHKMASDGEYRNNQQQCYQDWACEHPGYWRNYRHGKPEKANRNRLLQTARDRRRRASAAVAVAKPSLLAKMDASESSNSPRVHDNLEYWLVPTLAKMDALKVKITVVTGA